MPKFYSTCPIEFATKKKGQLSGKGLSEQKQNRKKTAAGIATWTITPSEKQAQATELCALWTAQTALTE